MRPPRVPSAPEELTADWLEGVLRESAPGLPRLVGIDGEEVGTGQVGRCLRYRLRWDHGTGEPRGRAPSSLIAKFASADPASREAGRSQSCYLFEVGFYREIAPTVRVRSPRCWFASIESNAVDHLLLLEDLAPARPGDQLRGCTELEAAAALVQLARLHAPRWADPSLRDIAWLEGPSEERAETVAELYAAVLPGFRERFRERLEPPVLERAARLQDRLTELLARPADPETVIHRDYRLDNLLFDEAASLAADPGEAPSVAVVDWQTVGRGAGASDVGYFLGTSLRRTGPPSGLEPLVRRYHRELQAHGVSDYRWRQCWRDVRAGSLGGLVMAVIASMLVGATDRGDAMFAAMARRSAALADALDADEVLGTSA